MASEAFRKDVSRQLTTLQDGTGPPQIDFAATLSSEERKYVHNLCHQFKLKSKSKGSGANRYLTVARKEFAAGSLGNQQQQGSLGKGGGKGGVGQQANVPAAKSTGTPLRLQGPFATDARLLKLPACPHRWTLTSPAGANSLRNSGSRQGSFQKAGRPQRATLEVADAARLKASPSGYPALQATRRRLPCWSRLDEILDVLDRHRVVLIAGETGCGKSTQVPQYLLDSVPGVNLLVTQPRRIAAISLAERVAQERCEQVGGVVGYNIHMDKKMSKDTRCTFCTTGVFRRRLLGDPQLRGVTHVVIDEVHERELHSDYVLIVLKELMEERKDLRLVLMSATLQLDVFQDYFPGCATVHVPGRTFPVHKYYLDDVAAMLYKTPRFRPYLGPGFAAAGLVTDEKDFKRQVATQESHVDQVCGYAKGFQMPMTAARLEDGCQKHDVLQQGKGTAFDLPIMEALIMHLDQEQQRLNSEAGAILVFLPGWADIDKAKRQLTASLPHGRFLILPCHSQVRAEQQREIFKRPPKGVRKIILATNMAETSITIEDVTVVIDTGRAKETSYDPYLKVGTLATTFVSKASSAQRAGRAGRVREGVCYHLFSRKRHEEMEDFRSPELLRSPLEDVCLHTAHLLMQQRQARGTLRGASGIAAWLAQAPQPPEAIAVKNAVELLKVIGALTPSGDISHLGVKFASLPVPASMARTVVWGALLGCLDPVLTVLGASSSRDVFQLPQDTGGGQKGGQKGGQPQKSNFGYLSQLLKKKKQDLAYPVDSDHWALVKAVEVYKETRHSGESAIRKLCDRYSLNSRALQGVCDQVDKLKQELKSARLLTDNLMEHFNRNSHEPGVILAVVAAGLFPHLAARRPSKKKIEVNCGRVEAGCHPQSVLEGGKGGGKGGKGKSKGKETEPSGPCEWLCYTELTQVEERYSLTGVSRVSPETLLLLCGDEPIEVQGAGPDVSVNMLRGWMEFQMPRDQAGRLQNLRYALRQAFLAHCEAPHRFAEHAAAVDCAVELLKHGVDQDCRPWPPDEAYRPSASAYVPKQLAADGGEDYRILEEAAAAAAEEAAAQRPGESLSWQMEDPSEAPALQAPELREGYEIEDLERLVKELYEVPKGSSPFQWSIESVGSKPIQFKATLEIVVALDGYAYEGTEELSKALARRSAAKVAWEALIAWQAGDAEEVVQEEEEELGLEEGMEEETVDVEDGDCEAAEQEVDGEGEEVWVPEVADDADLAEDVVAEDEVAEEEELGAIEELVDEDLLENSAALRFLQGDLSYVEAAGELEEFGELDEELLGDEPEVDAPAKRRRVQ